MLKNNSKNQLKSIVCNNCKQKENKFLFNVESHGDSYPLVKCKVCELVFMNPKPTRHFLDKYYSEKYNYDNFLVNKEQLIDTGKRTLDFVKKYKKKGKILEIGCMYGFFLKEANDYGFETYGIEKSKDAASYARNSLKLSVVSSDISDTSFKKESFDIIYMSHVIEHLIDPKAELKKIYQYLKPNSYLILKCPNFSSLSSKLMGKNWSWLCPPEHVYQFSPKTLSNMLISENFKIDNISTSHGDHSYLRYLSCEAVNLLPIPSRWKIKFRVGVDQNPNHFSQRIIFFLYKLFTPLVKKFHKKNLGQELVIVAKKNIS